MDCNIFKKLLSTGIELNPHRASNMCVCSINLRAFSSNFGTTNIFGPKEKSLLSFSLESLKVGSLSLDPFLKVMFER